MISRLAIALLSALLALSACTAGDGGVGSGGGSGSGDGTASGSGSGSGSGGSGSGSGSGSDDDGGDDDDGSGGVSTCRINQNGQEIECTNGACVCRIDGEQVDTCTAPDPTTACSSPGNCCGF